MARVRVCQLDIALAREPEDDVMVSGTCHSSKLQCSLFSSVLLSCTAPRKDKRFLHERMRV